MRNIVFLVLLLLVAASVNAEYYEYLDSDGVLRYTDDPSEIPAGQEVTTYESIENTPIDQQGVEQSSQEETKDAVGSVAMPGDFYEERAELQTIQEELQNIHADLEAQRAAIGTKPPRSADPSLKKEYNDKIQALNEKIDEYDKRSKEFEEKVKEYNSKIRK